MVIKRCKLLSEYSLEKFQITARLTDFYGTIFILTDCIFAANNIASLSVVKIQRNGIRIGRWWSTGISADVQTGKMSHFNTVRKESMLYGVPCQIEPSILRFFTHWCIQTRNIMCKKLQSRIADRAKIEISSPKYRFVCRRKVGNWTSRKMTSSITFSSVP